MAKFAEQSGWKAGGLSSGSEDDILNWMATYMVYSKKIPLYGTRPPSNKREHISFSDVRTSSFVSGATKLQRNHETNVNFIDLFIKASDLNQLIQNARAEGQTYNDD